MQKYGTRREMSRGAINTPGKNPSCEYLSVREEAFSDYPPREEGVARRK